MARHNYPASAGENPGIRLWRCPQCGEELFPADLENFRRCPYCDHPFRGDDRLEDYVLSPVVRQWIGKTRWPDSRG